MRSSIHAGPAACLQALVTRSLTTDL
jgi:hypothetical protein